jgi:hypothetical protein
VIAVEEINKIQKLNRIYTTTCKKKLNRVEYNRIELEKYLTSSRTHCGKWSEQNRE